MKSRMCTCAVHCPRSPYHERACCDADCDCWCHERERREEERRRLEYLRERERIIDGVYEISDADPGL